VGAQAAVFSVGYDRAPEACYPVAVEQAYGATLFVANEAGRLGIDESRIAVLGDGFGGNLAAVVALLSKQRRGPRLALQVLLTPVTSGDLDTGSYECFAEGPWLTRESMRRLWDAYLPDLSRRHEVTAAPLSALPLQLSGLPEALVCVAENDVLRDEGEAYARKLCEAGVRTTSVRYNGAIHDFPVLNPLADTPAARAVVAQVTSALCSAFG
jgi:acetyl esterase